MTINLNTIRLDNGAHNTRTEGVCLLEAVAWFAGEPHTDQPSCVSPVLGSFGRHLNDALPDDKRQRLTPFVIHLPGTVDDGLDEKRGYLALDWLVRVYTPTWLDAAGLADAAVYLRELPEVADLYSAKVAGEKVRRAREEARAAGAAAGAAAWDAAGAAAWDAAWDAARAAAWDAAWDAARAAAWDAAWDAARAAAWDAAWGAAGAAARDAAWDAARDAAGAAARAAARAAAWDAFAPIVTTLQDSAINLFENMINPR